MSLPKDTAPVTSARTPASFGERASNNSATRGKPPVISRVFELSCGILARTDPTSTFCPSRTTITDPVWKVILTDRSSPARFTSSPLSFNSFTNGRNPFAWDAPRRFGSITTIDDNPVTSSICLATVSPSSTFSKSTLPAYSVIIGLVCGSHVAIAWPAFTISPSRISNVAPYGALCRSRSRPLSSCTTISPLREIAINSLREFVT